jgi:hypothetical protein
MAPLVNVLFGAIFLRERLTRWQFISVLLVTAAVLVLTFGYGRFPWIAVVLCVSWGIYGLLRKLSGTAAIPGLFLETILLTPVAVAYLLILGGRGVAIAGFDQWPLLLLLISTGVVTGLPLVWFGHAGSAFTPDDRLVSCNISLPPARSSLAFSCTRSLSPWCISSPLPSSGPRSRSSLGRWCGSGARHARSRRALHRSLSSDPLRRVALRSPDAVLLSAANVERR